MCIEIRRIQSEVVEKIILWMPLGNCEWRFLQSSLLAKSNVNVCSLITRCLLDCLHQNFFLFFVFLWREVI